MGSEGKEKVEVKQVSEREIWTGESRIYLGEDNIIYITIVGKIDEMLATRGTDAVLKLANMVKGKVDLFIDLNKTTKPSPEARRMFIEEWSKNEKFGKIAIFGMHPVARVIASFVMGLSQKKDMRFFKTKEEALAWLKE